MKDYQNKITVNDEEVLVAVEPIVINAGSLYSIDVFTSYSDPSQKLFDYTPEELKLAFEKGVPIIYICTYGGEVSPKSTKSVQSVSINENHSRVCITNADYMYSDELTDMTLYDANNNERLRLHFYEEGPIGPVVPVE